MFYYTFTAESDSGRILKIDHLANLLATKYRSFLRNRLYNFPLLHRPPSRKSRIIQFRNCE